jgi:hypothetical protein
MTFSIWLILCTSRKDRLRDECYDIDIFKPPEATTKVHDVVCWRLSVHESLGPLSLVYLYFIVVTKVSSPKYCYKSKLESSRCHYTCLNSVHSNRLYSG